MINIPMKSKVPYDRTNISSINEGGTHGAVSAQNVESVNLWKSQAQTSGGQRSSTNQPGQGYQQPGFSNPPQQRQQQPGFSNPPQQRQQQPGFSNHPGQGYQNQTQPAYQAGSSSNQTQAAYQAGAVQNQTPAMPVQKPVPRLLKQVQKGQKVTLGVGTPLTAMKACFGWNSTNAACDVDVSAFMLGQDGRVIGDEWFVFYGQTNSPDNSTVFRMDNGADREIIDINLQRLNPAVKKIVFVLTINEAVEKHLHFGMMKDAYVRIMDPSNHTELVSFQMTDYYSNVISMMIGEVYQHNGAWKFNAVGNGVAKDLMGLCELYGVQVMD